MAHSPVRRFDFNLPPNFFVFPALLAVGVTMLAGCHPAVTVPKDPKDPKYVVAEKGTWSITRAELDKEINSQLKQHQVTAEQMGKQKMLMVETSTLKNMVLVKLILDRGATLPLQNVDKDEAAQFDTLKQSIPPGQSFDQVLKTAGLTVDDVKKQIHDRVVIGKVLEADAFKNADPTDQEISDFYLKNKANISTPPQVRASRILVHVDDKMTPVEKAAKKKIITKAYNRVAHGEDFSKVAMQVSEDRSSAPKGGDLDYFRPGENEPGFDTVAFQTKPGSMSAIFETPLGYQFLKVTDIKPGGEVPLADVRPKIASYLREMKMKQESKAYIDKLLADSGVTYHLTLVDPPAQISPTSPAAGADGAPPAAAPASSTSNSPSPSPSNNSASPAAK